jgi:hypothetical protein
VGRLAADPLTSPDEHDLLAVKPQPARIVRDLGLIGSSHVRITES